MLSLQFAFICASAGEELFLLLHIQYVIFLLLPLWGVFINFPTPPFQKTREKRKKREASLKIWELERLLGETTRQRDKKNEDNQRINRSILG